MGLIVPSNWRNFQKTWDKITFTNILKERVGIIGGMPEVENCQGGGLHVLDRHARYQQAQG